MKKVLNVLIIMIMIITFITGCVTQKKYSILSIPDNASIYYSKNNKFLEKEVIMIGSTPFPMSQVREGWYQIRKDGYINSEIIYLKNSLYNNKSFALKKIANNKIIEITDKDNQIKELEKLLINLKNSIEKPNLTDKKRWILQKTILETDEKIKKLTKLNVSIEDEEKKKREELKDELLSSEERMEIKKELKLLGDLKAIRTNVENILANIDKTKDKKDVEDYRISGKYWGKILKALYNIKNPNFEPQYHSAFVDFLLTKNKITSDSFLLDTANNLEIKTIDKSYYFRVHSNLKNAFHNGFRDGFEDRKADFILGANIEKAAELLGSASVKQLFSIIRDNQKREEDIAIKIAEIAKKYDYSNQYKIKLEIFIENLKVLFKELIAEGSRSDRVGFKKLFDDEYVNVFKKIQQNILIDEKVHLSSIHKYNNAVLHEYSPLNKQFIDIKTRIKEIEIYRNCNYRNINFKGIKFMDSAKIIFDKDLQEVDTEKQLFKISHNIDFKVDLSIPLAKDMWRYILQTSLKEVGKEMADKFSHNLITRVELINWIRRIMMSAEKQQKELQLVKKGFVNENFGTTEIMFDNFVQDTGLLRSKKDKLNPLSIEESENL